MTISELIEILNRINSPESLIYLVVNDDRDIAKGVEVIWKAGDSVASVEIF